MTINIISNSHYQRLLEGLAESISTKAYREVTLADITTSAKVSRRTFYEHFSDKDSCLRALCTQTSDAMMVAIAGSLNDDDDWKSMVERVTHTYLSTISEQPVLMRALYIELAAQGDEGLALRKQVAEEFAILLCEQVRLHRQNGEDIQEIDQTIGIAVIAGINELILHELMQQGGDVMRLQQTAALLVYRVTKTPDI